MPFIDSKITVPVKPEMKEELKSEMGRAIKLIGKTENWLMVGIHDNYDLWMAGRKLDRGAYVEVSLYGNASSAEYDRLTAKICDVFSGKLGIPPENIYVTYRPTADWGWNGGNF